jgi:hypothetical protein
MLDFSSDPSPFFEKRLAALLGSLREVEQRMAVFQRAMESLPPRDAAGLFQSIMTHGMRSRGRSNKILAETSLLCLLRRRWSPMHLEATRGAAAEAGLELSCLLLANVSDSADPGGPNEPIPNYTGGERPLTLGERRSIALRPDRGILSRAMLDPHPMVIARVLDNPRLREDDVILMASRRKASPAVLREIATHVKWRLKGRIAHSLVCNPALPMGLALSLLPGLAPGILADITTDESIAGLVRHVARALVATRKEISQHIAKTTDT